MTREREEEIAEVLKAYLIQEGHEALVALEFRFIAVGAASLITDLPFEVPPGTQALIGNPQQVLPHQLKSLVTFGEMQEFFDGFYYDCHMDEIHGTDWNRLDPESDTGWNDAGWDD